MKWTVLTAEPAKKQFQKLPEQIRRRIHGFLSELEELPNPCMRGTALVGKPSRWRYRVGDYRIICEIRHSELIVLVIEIDHRSKIYR